MNHFLILDSLAIFGILIVIIAILVILILIFVEQKNQTDFLEILNKNIRNNEQDETKNNDKNDNDKNDKDKNNKDTNNKDDNKYKSVYQLEMKIN